MISSWLFLRIKSSTGPVDWDESSKDAKTVRTVVEELGTVIASMKIPFASKITGRRCTVGDFIGRNDLRSTIAGIDQERQEDR